MKTKLDNTSLKKKIIRILDILMEDFDDAEPMDRLSSTMYILSFLSSSMINIIISESEEAINCKKLLLDAINSGAKENIEDFYEFKHKINY
jgi:hypothetical protein